MLARWLHDKPHMLSPAGCPTRPWWSASACLFSVLALIASGCTPGTYPNGGFPVYPGQVPPAGMAAAPGAVQAPTVGPNSVYAQQVTNPQLVELQQRVKQLDENNRQLTTQVAQSQQQMQAYRERADLLAKQLNDATQQNRQLMAASQQYANQARSMQASMSELQSSMNARGGARLTANNSLNGNAGNLQIAGVSVLPDGNLMRIRIPADQLFTPGTATANPAGSMILDQLAGALLRQYPRQRVGIEGHTDNAPIHSGAYSTPFQLSGAQAQAVMDELVRRRGVPMQQLFVIAHGPNHPIADNTTPAGRAENRRIEIVIYPETF